MSSPSELALSVFQKINSFDASKRVLIAIAGPPGAGKSTLAEALVDLVNSRLDNALAAAAPMDGFHYDNLILDAEGLRARKGSPETFDASGFLAMVQRLKSFDTPVAIPVFDRSMDLSRASARLIEPRHRLLIIEGNYLLLDRPIWRDLRAFFDFKVMLRPSLQVIETRLIQRWLDHGYKPDEAHTKARGNDLANARIILAESVAADLTISE